MKVRLIIGFWTKMLTCGVVVDQWGRNHWDRDPGSAAAILSLPDLHQNDKLRLLTSDPPPSDSDWLPPHSAQRACTVRCSPIHRESAPYLCARADFSMISFSSFFICSIKTMSKQKTDISQ